MTRRQIFVRGMIAGILVGLMLQAVNWLYSAHPEASDFRRFTVIVQAVLSAIGAIWLARGIPGEPDIAAQRVAEIARPAGQSESAQQWASRRRGPSVSCDCSITNSAPSSFVAFPSELPTRSLLATGLIEDVGCLTSFACRIVTRPHSRARMSSRQRAVPARTSSAICGKCPADPMRRVAQCTRAVQPWQPYIARVPTTSEFAMAVELTAVFQAVPEGYLAFVEELPGANTQGATLDEARANLREAVVLVMEANRAMAEEDLAGAAVIREPLRLSA